MADFTNHLWLVASQESSLSTSLRPSYFMNTTTEGIFNPWFGFYGGTLYTSVGAIGALLGDRPIAAYVGVTLVAMGAAYGGLLWLARQLGLRGWTAHAPALTFVTSAYYVTNLYGRGAWTEFMAVSSIPLLLAAGTYLARNDHRRTVPATLFVVSAVYFTGSHTITLAWGTLVILGTLAILVLATGRRAIPRTRLWRLLALTVVAVAVNAWFLVPELFYAHTTVASATPFSWSSTEFLNTPSVIFDPFRTVSKTSSTPALYVQAPDWFLVWALLAMMALPRARANRLLRRSFLALSSVLVALFILIMVSLAWDVVPHPLKAIQFPYRLNTYVALLVAGLVLIAALPLEASSGERPGPAVGRALRAGLAGAAAVSLALCVWQLWVPQTELKGWSYDNRANALVSAHTMPRTWYAHSDFADLSPPVVAVPPGRGIYLDPNLVRADRLVETVTPPPGPKPFQTNILGSPLVTIHGIVRLGRTLDGYVVGRREGAGSGPVRIVVERAATAPVEAGSVLSVVSLAILAALLGRCGWQAASRIGRRSLGGGKELPAR